MLRLGVVIKSLFQGSRSGDRDLSHEELVVQKELEEYSILIAQHFQYFNELSNQLKQRFLLRVRAFMDKKKFHYIGLEPSPQIPVLICAAAVQITFGLKKYKMSFFKAIYVMAHEYTYGLSVEPWIGHVNRKGIFISWKHFIEGYTVNNDRSNVGLHEMAHALVYANFLGGLNGERHFITHFERYQKRADKLVCDEKWKLSGLFSPQTINNYHECWAECIELFFENPSELSQQYPELYHDIKETLNQDPLNKVTIVKPFPSLPKATA